MDPEGQKDASQDKGSGADGEDARDAGTRDEVELKDKGVEEGDRGPEPSRSRQKGSETDRARQINEVERPGGGDS